MNRRADNERMMRAFADTFTIDDITTNPRLGVLYRRLQQLRGTCRQLEPWFVTELATQILGHGNR
jgi:hypothetical protein